MPRRVRLPGADELFRSTSQVEADAETEGDAAPSADRTEGAHTSSRRVKHDAKVTVYMTADELLGLEHARLSLRRELGRSLDRGRLVREAIAIVLADYDEHGEDSEIVRRLGAS
ncbi:hypothetical protein CLV56_2859 [Mumia flava]|uniref:Cobyrinic acid a,c-diamide synthase n=1 Tax=Mumia flava TaxID=1348852 RepID=A0A0B2B8B0_9ACTN|nr:hypothetical protein [Mumia flava]PJJ53372.1 hypothetical protein CLV56_2859 [Mumia flava]